MTSEYFLLQDDTRGSRAKYRFHLEFDSDKKSPVLIVAVETFADEIYHDVMRKKVIFPKPTLLLRFTSNDLVRFLAMLVEAASKHLASIRRKLYLKDTLEDHIELSGCDYNVSLQAHNIKISASGREKNSARLVMIIYDKDNQEQVVLRLKRNKIVWMLQTIRELYRIYIPKTSFVFEDMRGQRRLLIKNSDFVALGSIWLHGRELQKFQDYIERVVFDFTYATGDAKEFFRYRQVSALFSDVQNVGMISLQKRTSDHQIYYDTNGNTEAFEFLITSEIVAKLFLVLPVFFAKSTDAELRQIKNSSEDIGSSSDAIQDITVVDTQEILEPERDGDYVINLIEAVIALRVDRIKKFNVKSGDGLMRFYVRYRDGILQDDNYKVYSLNASGEMVEARKLPLVSIDLGIDWLNIFACIAESLHHKGNSEEHGVTLNRKWNFVKRTLFGGNERYEVRIIIAESNRAVALIIDQYVEEINEYTGLTVEQHHGRFRVPLFKEHIRSLMKGLIRISGLYESYYFSKKVEVYDDKESIFVKKTFGIKRAISGKGEEYVSFGTLGEKSSISRLNKEDRDHLFKSAYYRLLYGRWIPFVGDNVSISFDGYLTDLRNEYRIEFDLNESNGAGGSLAALAILFGTIRPELINEGGESGDTAE